MPLSAAADVPIYAVMQDYPYYFHTLTPRALREKQEHEAILTIRNAIRTVGKDTSRVQLFRILATIAVRLGLGISAAVLSSSPVGGPLGSKCNWDSCGAVVGEVHAGRGSAS